MNEQPNSTTIAHRSLVIDISRNTFFGVIASLTQMGTRLVTVPIVIAYLGLEGYGIWSIIMVAAGYMRFGSAGVKSAFLKYVAEATGNGTFEKASQLLSTGSAVMFGLSVIGLIPLAIFSDDIIKTIGVPDHLIVSAAGSITLLAVIMVLSNVGGVYESIVMGGHRIDLIRVFNTVASIVEAVAIVVALCLGYGLITMAAIMASSEMVRLLCCYYVSKQIVPDIKIGMSNISSRVLPDLVTFAGSYQLVAILEVAYTAILPLAILKLFGAYIAGLYAVAYRLVSAALLPSEAFVLPLLSSASLVQAGGSNAQMQQLLTKSFKATCALVMLPLAFTATYGSIIILAWTGLVDPALYLIVGLLCLAALFKGFSLLELALYRASGRASMDNLRQVLRIVILGLVCYFGNQIGILGLIGSLVIAECVGFVFMLIVLTRVYENFSARRLLPDMAKILAATLIVMAVGVLSAHLPIAWIGDPRQIATLKLGIVSFVTVLALWPAVLLTGSLSRYELNAVLPMSFLSRSKFGLRS